MRIFDYEKMGENLWVEVKKRRIINPEFRNYKKIPDCRILIRTDILNWLCANVMYPSEL